MFMMYIECVIRTVKCGVFMVSKEIVVNVVRRRLMQNASDIRKSVREIIDCVMNDGDFTWTMYVIVQRRGVKAMKCEYATHKLIVMARDRHLKIEAAALRKKFTDDMRKVREELAAHYTVV